MQEFIYDPAYWRHRHFLFFDYACRTDATEVRLNDEAQEFVWATLDEALLLPTEPYTDKAIRNYLAQQAGRRPPASVASAVVHSRYVHTNLIARDWQALARFYETVFGCVRVLPARDLAGPAMEAGTGIAGAHLCGIHLRLPGYDDAGPTVEIFTYDALAERPPLAVNRPGYGHLAFSVDDVAAARVAVLAAGGHLVGDVVTVEVKGGGRVTWCYMTDPEGNVIELQAWAKVCTPMAAMS